jgi:predicted flap endonuclease-1-like 5' DNA nuclease
LRGRLSAQHQETRTEQKNNELLRSEVAVLRTEKAKWEQELQREEPSAPSEPAPSFSRPSQWPARQRAKSRHAEDLEKLRADHRLELDKVRSHHATEIANLKKSLFAGAKDTDDSSAKLQELEAKYEARLEALRRRLREVEHESSKTHLEELQRALDAERETSARLAQELELLRSHSAPASQANSSHDGLSSEDDLTQLKGVGPKMAQALRQEGIASFRQIANWEDDDMERIAPKIRFSAARIKKNGWVATARRLS